MYETLSEMELKEAKGAKARAWKEEYRFEYYGDE
jgi:hypothetical protein